MVIPACRAEPFILRAVLSVLGQTWTDREVVIASDDGVDYARLLHHSGLTDPRIRCAFTGGVGTGPANARNTGLRAASGRIVATLDADDVLAPDALARLAPLALRHGAAYSRPRLLDGLSGAALESFDRPLPTGPATLEEILATQTHTYAGIVFDRLRVTATWPAWMQRWEDVYFYVRCFDDVDFIYHVAEPLYTYHRTPGSICNRRETAAEYLAWADHLATRLEQGDPLGLHDPASRDAFGAFLRTRCALEAGFIGARDPDRANGFHAFARLTLEAAGAPTRPAPVASGRPLAVGLPRSAAPSVNT